jgi:hypothetical protein
VQGGAPLIDGFDEIPMGNHVALTWDQRVHDMLSYVCGAATAVVMPGLLVAIASRSSSVAIGRRMGVPT